MNECMIETDKAQSVVLVTISSPTLTITIN